MKMKIMKKLSGAEFRIEEIEITSFEYNKNKVFTYVRKGYPWYVALREDEYLIGVDL